MLTLLRLLRAQQWYKNTVIFLALFFTKNLFTPDLLESSILGFISLCFMSSSYYIINDILDAREDRQHPEKKTRPIAAGTVGVGAAALLSLGLMAASLFIAFSLSAEFALFPIALLASSLAYNFWLRKVAIVDVHVIAFNFLLRAVSGAVLIDVYASPWLVTTVFFMALFLAVGKRRSDLSVLKDALKHKDVYAVYNERLLDMMIVVITAVLLFTYSLYTFVVHEKPYPYMMLTIPFVSFIIFRYLYFISINHEVSRKTHLVFLDAQMLAGLLLWVAVSYAVMYYMIPVA
ncbi:MAG: UbiA prenyltransferase family protein [Candidatus Altiarchaeota archaeon]|nr:UbiA prenyltransferase family protein [Candidatus Altiarchaeota archaeon]